MTAERIKELIKEMPVYKPVSEIEAEVKMPPTTLQKVLKGGRKLPQKWVKPLEAYFNTPKTEVKDLTRQSTGTTKNLSENKPKTNYTVSTEIDKEAILEKIKQLEQSKSSSMGGGKYETWKQKEIDSLKKQLK